MCLVEKVDINDDGNDDEDDVEEGDDDDDDDGQVCLLGTGDIDRRRSCISDGGFRLIENFATDKYKQICMFLGIIHYSLIMMMINDHGSVA